MQRDLEMMAKSDGALDQFLEQAIRKLGSNEGMTYDERTALALAICRVLVELKIRETEAAIRGAYDPRSDQLQAPARPS